MKHIHREAVVCCHLCGCYGKVTSGSAAGSRGASCRRAHGQRQAVGVQLGEEQTAGTVAGLEEDLQGSAEGPNEAPDRTGFGFGTASIACAWAGGAQRVATAPWRRRGR